MAMTTAIPVVAGVVVILVIIRDVFHTLFHPSSSGALSSRVIRVVWGTFKAVSRRRTERLSLAGPISLLTVIALWTIAITLGWALVLWPLLPEGFLFSTGLEPADNAGFRDAIYLSMVTLATLGYGDITPQDTWLRIIAPLEAMLGFGIITAAISWILSVNPILSRRRRLARQVALLHENSHWATMVEAEDSERSLTPVLLSLTEQVISARSDYEHAPITYYFRQTDRSAAMDVALPRLALMADAASRHTASAVRMQAEMLRSAVHDLTAHIGADYLDLPDADVEAILHAYADDQLRERSRLTHDAAAVMDRDER
jgi:hypothetical protein